LKLYKVFPTHVYGSDAWLKYIHFSNIQEAEMKILITCQGIYQIRQN